tara:strand:+ start:238 stop:858 length:621 start_codon:yes stop_codon:yes gene_type:complete
MFVLPEAQLFHLVRKKLKRTPVIDFFKGKTCLLLLVPGAFTPDDTVMVKEWEAVYDDFYAEFGVEEIYFLAMCDPYVMDAWWKSMKIKKCKYLPDGNGALSLRINENDGLSEGDCCCTKFSEGMYKRNWRSVVLVQDGMCIWNTAEEAPKVGKDESGQQPYEVTTPDSVKALLKNRDQSSRIAEINAAANIRLQESSPIMGGGSPY